MTALKEYERIEAIGLWRARPEDQRREVVVSIGEATLTITDLNSRALAHWSLAAIMRADPEREGALFHPDGDPGETLELGPDEATMIEAIDRLRRAVDRLRPRPGRLRWFGVLAMSLAAVALAVFWLPGALMQHTLRVVPDIKRQDIGQALLGRVERVAGQACATGDTRSVLAALARRTGIRQLVILRAGVVDTAHLPGGIVLMNKALIEDFEDPAVAAGYALAERIRAEQRDPLGDLLLDSGPIASFRLLTTGELTKDILDRYAEHVLVAPRAPLPDSTLLDAFAEARIPTRPYAYARDITGEAVLGLIEADPMTGSDPDPVMRDRDWVLLQNICGG